MELLDYLIAGSHFVASASLLLFLLRFRGLLLADLACELRWFALLFLVSGTNQIVADGKQHSCYKGDLMMEILESADLADLRVRQLASRFRCWFAPPKGLGKDSPGQDARVP
jgi:hypothetical protein